VVYVGGQVGDLRNPILKKIGFLRKFLCTYLPLQKRDNTMSAQTAYKWLLSETSDLQEVIELRSINCGLALTDIYDKVEIENRDKKQIWSPKL
jgi:hypothetical protein